MKDFNTFVDWIFYNQRELNSFMNSCFENYQKTNSLKTNKRNIDMLNELDFEYIKKDYGKKSENSISDLKSEVKSAYMTKKYSLRFIDWYIIKPISKNGIESSQIFFALYFPCTEAIDEIKRYIIDKTQPCFECDYIIVTDMTNGKESVIFLGGLDEPEPNCTSLTKEHKWDWCIYRDDTKEILFAECKTCGITKSAVIGDDRGYQWNENHGWRYNNKKNN